MKPVKIEEHSVNFTFFQTENLQGEFIPWQRYENGQQVFIKMTRGTETGLLYAGEHRIMDAEIQQALIRLVNDGWKAAGEVTVTFDGTDEPGVDPYVFQDPVTVELGQALLPLVDPQNKAPLISMLPGVRDEVAKETGLVAAGIRIKDNLALEPNEYVIQLKNSPIAKGELFLNRYMAAGSHDQLSELEGWATIEPAFRMKAKWIEPSLRDKADQLGCLVVGPLQVLLTHIKQIIINASPELLGLQETYNLIARLKISHPIVVEDFLNDRRNLRKLRRVMQNLLAEGIAVNDLVTILETAGDMLDILDDTAKVTESCRLALASQICWSHLNADGELRGMVLAANIEKALSEAIGQKKPTILSGELAEAIISAVRRTMQESGNPPVLFTEPVFRPLMHSLVARIIPGLSVMSTAEIVPGIKVVITGTVDLNPQSPDKLGDDAPQAEPDAQAKDQHQTISKDADSAASAGTVTDNADKKAEKTKSGKEHKKDRLLGFLKPGKKD